MLEDGDSVLDDGRLYDTYTFEGQTAQTIAITLESLDFDTYVALLDQKGNLITSNDDIDTSAGNYHSFIEVNLSRNGVYHVLVSSANSSSRGQYRLVVAEATPGQARPMLSSAALTQLEVLRLISLALSSHESALSRDEFQHALEYAQQGLARAQDIQDIRLEGYSLYVIGQLYTDGFSRYQEALEVLERAFDISEQINDPSLATVSLLSLSLVHVHLGNHQETISLFNQASVFAEEINDESIEALLYIPAYAHVFLGNYQEAIQVLEVGLSSARKYNLHRPESHSLGILGLAYLYLGDYDKARDFAEQSLAIAEENQDLIVQSNPLFVLGAVYIHLSQYQRGIDFAERSVQISREAGIDQIRIWGLITLASGYVGLDRHEEAVNISNEALQLARELGDKKSEANALRILGHSSGLRGEYQEAINYYQRALPLSQEAGDRNSEGFLFGALGQILSQQNQPELAVTFLKASVQVRESIRGDIRGLDSSLQQSFTDTVADDYRRLANLLLNQGRIPEAQQVLDLLQLEELREFTNTRAAWTGTALAFTDPEQTVIDAHGSLIALGSRILDCEATNCADLEAYYGQQEALKAQYDNQVAEFNRIVRANRADDDVFQNPETISGEAEELLAAYAEAGETAVLIYPFVLEDKLWLVWATAGNVIGSVEVPVPQAELSATVQRFGELLNRGALDDLQATSQQLYGWIIEPLEAELEKNGVDHLIFVNDRVTRYIPMAALFDGENFLIERYRVSTVLAPAVTETDGRLGAVDESQVLGLGLTQAVAGLNPLPAVKEELAAIVRDNRLGSGIFPGRVFLDNAFTFDALRDNVASHRVLHVATHAAFVPGRAEESYIVLGNGDRLFIPDIETIERRLRNLHLVVLSACQTALGGPSGNGDGTEIAGLSSYFLRPGRAEAVVASLWKVDDSSTSLLMQRFYEFLATGELTKAEALRQAQLSLLYNEDTATRLAASRASISVETLDGRPLSAVGSQHPYHWAPFILIGNGL
ncbi:MAG: CHAT domain-containing protein [Spirulina sp.]